MLAIAADWRAGLGVRSVDEIMREPSLAHYISGWPGKGDVGFIAQEVEPVGATWWRFFSRLEPGYGFVNDSIPEVSIGVREAARGRGIGTLLLVTLIEKARRQGLPALSLSVEPDNPATVLYERVGFLAIDRSGGAITMALKLHD